jgi:hypothetical protein
MKAHAPVRFSGRVSPRLLLATNTIQEIFHTWYRELLPVAITGELASTDDLWPDRGVACFFSGGLDSFYTILKHRHEIDALVTVEGYAIRLADADVQADVNRTLMEAAAELGKPLVVVTTNIQDISAGLVDWPLQGGPALASVALLLAPLFRKVLIPAGMNLRRLVPWGSHPLVDPLWSTEIVEIVHDGCEATRVDKAAVIATSETALRHLRVCWGYREAYERGLYNCGRCAKCLRTQVDLYLAGALERCSTLDHSLNLSAISRMPLPSEDSRIHPMESLKLAERLRSDPALIRALRVALGLSTPGTHSRPDAAESKTMIRRLQEENANLRTAVQALRESRSWKITRPFRALADACRRLRG